MLSSEARMCHTELGLFNNIINENDSAAKQPISRSQNPNMKIKIKIDIDLFYGFLQRL